MDNTRNYEHLPDVYLVALPEKTDYNQYLIFIKLGWVDPGFKGKITLELFNANLCAIELESFTYYVFSPVDPSYECLR